MNTTTDKKEGDVFLESACDGDAWVYSEIVKEHFFNPRNLMIDETGYEADGFGATGSPACGDMMNMWIKIDKTTNKIKEFVYRFCCSK